jgi:DNA-binding transcriptional regulator YiaG
LRTECVLSSGKPMDSSFSEKLNQLKKELEVTQVGLCNALFNVPHRTLQSWLQGEKEPPIYMQKLILFRLRFLLNTDPGRIDDDQSF